MCDIWVCVWVLSEQVVVLSLVKALPGIWNVTMLVSIFWLIFSILGVSLFKGKLQTCDTDDSLDKDACLAMGYNWVPDPFISFDSTFDLVVHDCVHVAVCYRHANSAADR